MFNVEYMAQDLCERHEKGVLHEHQKALQKYSVMKRQMMSAAVQPKEQVSVEQLESRIVQVSFRTDTPLHLNIYYAKKRIPMVIFSCIHLRWQGNQWT